MSDFLQLHRKHFSFKKFVRNVIEEDLGDGDHTSLSTIPSSKKGKMQLLVKERGIIAGVDAAEKIIKRFGLEEYSNIKTETRFVQLLQTIFQSARNSLIVGSSGQFVSGMFTVILLWAGAVPEVNVFEFDIAHHLPGKRCGIG